MGQLSIFFTLCLVVFSHLSMAKECRELELGAIGRNYWVDSLGNGVRGEFEKQVQKKNNLFDPFLPELEFDIGVNGKVKLTFDRDVSDYLVKPKENKLSSTDFFSLRVDDSLHLEIGAGISGDYLFTGANAGINLRHIGQQLPGKSLSHCEFYSKIFDLKSEKGREMLEGIEAACKSRDKTKVSEYYEKLVDYGSASINWGFKHFINSEKNKVFTKDILDPLKLHSLLGIPIDHELFFENNRDLNIGDMVEHTTFYNFTPAGVKFDILSGIFAPSSSVFGRWFRTVIFKKELLNQVSVEVEDSFIYGNNTEIYKLKPKILKILKINLGRWTFDDYSQLSLRQQFKVNLNHIDGRKFFKKLLSSMYKNSVVINKDTILIDYNEYKNGIEVKHPIFTDADGNEKKLQFKLPGLFSYDNESYTSIKNIKHNDREYTVGEKIHQKSLENSIALNFGLFEIKEEDRYFECKMKLAADMSVNVDDNSSLNMICNYFDRYANNKKLKGVKEYLNMILLGGGKPSVMADIESANYERDDILNMSSVMSFSKKEIEKILTRSNDEVYAAVTNVLFGPSVKNIFAEKYHKKWSYAPIKNIQEGHNYKKLYTLNKCSELLYKLGITDKSEKIYDEFNGVVGNRKGVSEFGQNRCYSFYLLAKDLVAGLNKLQVSMKDERRLNKFLNLFNKLEKAGFLQSVLVKLAGGIGEDRVRYTYYVSSPYIKNFIAESNGHKYEVEESALGVSLADEMQKQFYPRISDMKFIQNTCEKDVLLVVFKMNYRPKERKNIYAKFTLKNFSALNNAPIGEYLIPFDHMINNTQGEYIARIVLDKPLSDDHAHNMYVKLINENDFRLSRELQIYMKKINSLLSGVLQL